MNKTEGEPIEPLTEEEAKNQVLQIAAGLGVVMLGTAGAYYFKQPLPEAASAAAAIGSGIYTLKNVVDYVSKLG